MDKIQKLKITQTVLLVSYLGMVILFWVPPDYNTIAFEKAVDDLPYEDYLILLDFYDNWDRHTDSNAIVIENITSGLAIVVVASVIQTSRYIYSLETHEERSKP